MRWLFTLLMAAAPAFAGDGTYAYCSKDNCGLVNKGKLHLTFGSIPVSVRTHCIEPDMYAMTFDDGPSDYYPEVLDILDKRGVKATFFVVGNKIDDEEAKSRLKLAYEAGHQISNHSWSHPDLMKKTDDEVVRQLKDTEAAIVGVLGESKDVVRDARIMRPPFGYIDARVQKVVEGLGYTSVRWNSDRSDWELGTDKQELALKRLDRHLTFIKSSISPSVLDLNHDHSGATRAGLEVMIDRIEKAGYRFVTVGECLGSR